MITRYARKNKKHQCIEQSFGLCGRGRGWDDLADWQWNMYNTICEMICQSRFDAWYRVLWAGALGWPRGMGWGGRREGGSGWGTHVHSWQIQVNPMAKPIQYCKVKWWHGNPLQYSCLENPIDRGAWWATVHRVAESWTQLKWLSVQASTSLKWADACSTFTVLWLHGYESWRVVSDYED